MTKMEILFVVLFTLMFVIVICLIMGKDASFNTKEGLGGGGFAATSGLNLYNSARHCWKSEDDDQVYCSTDGRVMF